MLFTTYVDVEYHKHIKILSSKSVQDYALCMRVGIFVCVCVGVNLAVPSPDLLGHVGALVNL